jgi:hypothetical protein
MVIFNLYTIANVLEKVRKTISYLTPAIIGIVFVWCESDISLFVTGAVAITNSIIDYTELFIKKVKE